MGRGVSVTVGAFLVRAERRPDAPVVVLQDREE
jgi:hypothetical protein